MPNDAQVSDRALIHRVLDGDPQSADLLVARFTRLVWWILTHPLRLASETAEEVYQDVFVHLWEDDYRRLRNWSGEGDFASYLSPIVRHRGLDRIKQDRARNELVLPAGEPTGLEPVEQEPGPEELVRIEEQRRWLERAVAGLGVPDRRLYELRFVEERSYREIAAALGITVNNVGVRLNRLVERLQGTVAADVPSKNDGAAVVVRSPGPGPSTE